MDYDAWLEKPYQDDRKLSDDYSSACELFINTDTYWEHYEQWAIPLFKKDIHCSTEAWHDTEDFKMSVESYWERLNESPEPPEDREYRTRGWD